MSLQLNLEQVVGNSYFVTENPRSPAPGVVLNHENKTAILIDTGPSETFAKAIDKALRQAGYTAAAIINTHHHPDHHGGNAFFQNKYPEIKIFVTQYEKSFIENTLLEPLYLSSGAQPFNWIENDKFLNARPSLITDVIPNDVETYPIEVQGLKLTTIALPGHTRGMIGVATEDGVLYVSDAVFGELTLNLFGLLYHTYITSTLNTLTKIDQLSERYPHLVMYHGGKAENLSSLIEKNRQKIIAAKEFFLSTIQTHPNLSIDDLTMLAVKKYESSGQEPPPSRFILNRTIVMAFLSDLERDQQIKLEVQDGKLVCKGIR